MNAKPRAVRLLDREPPKPATMPAKVPSFLETTRGAKTGAAEIPRQVGKYVVEAGVPMTPKRTRKSVVDGMPFGLLKIGDSFAAPDVSYKSAAWHCKAAERRFPDRKFAFRQQPQGVRFWRIEVKA